MEDEVQNMVAILVYRKLPLPKFKVTEGEFGRPRGQEAAMAPSFMELARSRTSVLYEWVGAQRPAEAWGYGGLARRKPMGWGISICGLCQYYLWYSAREERG